MDPATAVIAIAEVAGAIFSIADMLTPDEVNEYTVYDFTGNSWIGTATYDYTNENGNTTSETATCIFTSAQNYDGKLIFSGSHVTVRLKSTGSSGNVPSITASTGTSGVTGITYKSGSYYTLEYSINSLEPETHSNISVTSGGSVRFGSDGYWNRRSSVLAGQISSTTLTTDPTIHNHESSAPYVPPGNYTFDELRNALINQYNIDYDLDIPIDTPDIPTYKDLAGESDEPTETGSGSGFEFDYGEVISPSELESILDQESYDLEELDTELPDLSFQLPDATFSAEQITLLTDSLNASYSFFDGLGLSSTLIALGVLAGLLRLIRGG